MFLLQIQLLALYLFHLLNLINSLFPYSISNILNLTMALFYFYYLISFYPLFITKSYHIKSYIWMVLLNIFQDFCFTHLSTLSSHWSTHWSTHWSSHWSSHLSIHIAKLVHILIFKIN